jgi:uncharacterized membrane protein
MGKNQSDVKLYCAIELQKRSHILFYFPLVCDVTHIYAKDVSNKIGRSQGMCRNIMGTMVEKLWKTYN